VGLAEGQVLVVRLVNWSRYQSEDRRAGAPWVCWHSKVLANAVMQEPWHVKGLWPYLILDAGRENGQLRIDSWWCHRMGATCAEVHNALHRLEALGLVEVTDNLHMPLCNLPRLEDSRGEDIEENTHCAPGGAPRAQPAQGSAHAPPDQPALDLKGPMGQTRARPAFATDFWGHWPKGYKKNRCRAQPLFDRIMAKGTVTEAWALLHRMLQSLDVQKRSRQWQRGVIPNPDTWLRQERWNDDAPPTSDSWRSTPVGTGT